MGAQPQTPTVALHVSQLFVCGPAIQVSGDNGMLTETDAIEAEAVLFDSPVMLTLSGVVGCHISGTVNVFCSSTDVVLAITKVPSCQHVDYSLSTLLKIYLSNDRLNDFIGRMSMLLTNTNTKKVSITMKLATGVVQIQIQVQIML